MVYLHVVYQIFLEENCQSANFVVVVVVFFLPTETHYEARFIFCTVGEIDEKGILFLRICK